MSARDLEALLEVLSHVNFPINPQIYHAEKTTVEFPAYAGGLAQVRAVLADSGFDPEAIRIKGMMEQIQSLLKH